MLIIKTPCVINVTFEHFSHLSLVFSFVEVETETEWTETENRLQKS